MKRRALAASITGLGIAAALANGCGSGIIGPCNPPQISCARPTAATAPRADQGSAMNAEAAVNFSGTVVSGQPPASAPSPAAGSDPLAAPSASPSPSVSPSPTPSPTATPVPAVPAARPVALLFARDGKDPAQRVELDASGNFSASLAPGTYRLTAILRAEDASERAVTGDNATLTFAAGEAFSLQIAITGPAGQEQLAVEKKPATT